MRICLQGHPDKRNASKCEVCGLATTLVCPDTLKPVKEPEIDGVMVSCDSSVKCILQSHRWMYVAPMKEIMKDCDCVKDWKEITPEMAGEGLTPSPCKICRDTGKVGSGSFHKKTDFKLDPISEINDGEFQVFPFLHS